MHWIVAFAGQPGAAGASLATPALDRLISQARTVAQDTLEPTQLNASHERVWARELGSAAERGKLADGALPWAARLAAMDGLEHDAQPLGLLTPVHWRVTTDGVELADPSIVAPSESEVQALMSAVRPYLEEDGFRLLRGPSGRWYVQHEGLATLRTPSVDRAVGRRVDAWQPQGPLARTWLRLQNEVQMLWHAHAVNDQRESRRELPINSLWLSGTGPAWPRERVVSPELIVDERLRTARMDEVSWREAWAGIDREVVAPLLDAPAHSKLSLCGDHGSVTYEAASASWWRKWLRGSPRSAASVLESL